MPQCDGLGKLILLKVPEFPEKLHHSKTEIILRGSYLFLKKSTNSFSK